MTESFACKSEWIHFSNSAVESLYAAWIAEAIRQRSRSGMAQVERFLQQLLNGEGPGCRSFGLFGEYLPEDIANADALSAFAELIRHTIDDPRSMTGITWDDEMISSWRKRLEPMLESVKDSARCIE